MEKGSNDILHVDIRSLEGLQVFWNEDRDFDEFVKFDPKDIEPESFRRVPRSNYIR
jgi:hypothetical protein